MLSPAIRSPASSGHATTPAGNRVWSATRDIQRAGNRAGNIARSVSTLAKAPSLPHNKRLKITE
jgi:hypothetical protein